MSQNTVATMADYIRRETWSVEALHLHALANEHASQGNLVEARKLWAEAIKLATTS